MGYLFTLLYIVVSFLSPPLVFGSLADYHVEVILIFLALICSIPSYPGSGTLRSPQSIAIAGMSLAIVGSSLFNGWLGGAFGVLYAFLQPVLIFYLVAVNCRTKRHFSWMILALSVGSAIFIYLGAQDIAHNVTPSIFVYEDGALLRLRGLGLVNDPNDLAQVMVSLMPALFIVWGKNKLGNLFLVLLPVGVLLYGTFLTHSRGASLAMLAVVAVAAQRKIGKIPAMLVAGALFMVTVAIGWSGGRDTSMASGADRLELWSGGLQLIKHNPIFGVGVGNFANYMGLTAHNSVVVCAAEMGLVGLFFWVLFMFSTVRSSVRMGAFGLKKSDAVAAETPLSRALQAHSGQVPVAQPETLAAHAAEPFPAYASSAHTSVARLQAAYGMKPATMSSSAAVIVQPGLTATALRSPDFRSSAAVPVAVPVALPDTALAGPGSGTFRTALASAASRDSDPFRTPPATASQDTPRQPMTPEEVGRIARLLVLALTGTFTAGWFLSRAFASWLFMYCGMVCALIRIARENGMTVALDDMPFLLRWSAITSVLLIALVYIMLRLHAV